MSGISDLSPSVTLSIYGEMWLIFQATNVALALGFSLLAIGFLLKPSHLEKVHLLYPREFAVIASGLGGLFVANALTLVDSQALILSIAARLNLTAILIGAIYVVVRRWFRG